MASTTEILIVDKERGEFDEQLFCEAIMFDQIKKTYFDDWVSGLDEETENLGYQYKECGLDNVFLYDCVKAKEIDCEIYYTVKNTKSLRRAIGTHIASKEGQLTDREITFLRKSCKMEKPLEQEAMKKHFIKYIAKDNTAQKPWGIVSYGSPERLACYLKRDKNHG